METVMHSNLYNRIKNSLLPCLSFSIITGVLSALIITAFKILVEIVIEQSTHIFASARTDAKWIPVIVLGAGIIGLVASLILSKTDSCRGGGISTSVAAIRGIVSFKWLSSIFVLPISALLTFFCGVPLGTEGPCVQMGTAIGCGVTKISGSKSQRGWLRYIMTGGAAAGFSIATASPVSAIIFSMEELHKRFSPLLMTVASVSVISAQVTVHVLSLFEIGTLGLFHLPVLTVLPTKLLFVPLIVGLASGVCSILFTRFYHFVDRTVHSILKKVSIKIVFPILFACVSVVGILFFDALGTGHGLTDRIFEKRIMWYTLILIFLIRMLFMMISNTSGVTGGVFLPTIAFGAIIGAIGAEGMIRFGWIPEEHYVLVVVLGIASFLGATSRIPITACVFAMEALGGINNVLPIIIATTVAALTVEQSGIEDFTDAVIGSKIRSISKGKKPTVIETSLTVKPNSFAEGKELRDILWPNECRVVSFDRASSSVEHTGLSEGDVITVHYKTYNPEKTSDELKVLVGDQSEAINTCAE